ncbi:MAG TPA: type II toxin-antitoxin system death-on-curing family toxin [Ktedonobacterales bacterium]
MTIPPSIRYLTANEVWAIDDIVLRREGGSSLLRDRGVLESAIMRPQMAAHYEQADIVTQAALLIAGIALAHPFLDGNKRTAAIAGATFLDLNGYLIDVTSKDDAFGRQIETLVTQHEDLDAGTVQFAQWLRSVVIPKPSSP